MKEVKIFCNREILYFELCISSFNSYVYYLTRSFIFVTRVVNLSTRAFNLLTCAFELVNHKFALVTCKFEPIIRGFEIVTRKSGRVTRVLLFHFIKYVANKERKKIVGSEYLAQHCG